MRTYLNLFAFIVTLLISFISFGQERSYSFKIDKTGNGKQTVIFIPGFASSADVWNETVSQFDEKFTCYTLTMAGFAGVRPKENSSFNTWSNEIARFIKKEKINSPIIIGHSMGGGLALNIASDHPKLVKKILVIDALPCLMALTNPSFTSKDNNNCSPMINQIMAMSDEQFAQMQKASVKTMTTNVNQQNTIVQWSLDSDKKTFASMYCDFLNIDLRNKIKSIECPSYILLQSHFKNFKTQIGSQYKNLKTANLEYANKGLHFIMYDDKEWYFNQLKENILSE
ncbi:Pimeloyl-ACP methyl ester carboxylesterase [Tenacibaculum sp. MAR_2009_124]|uniref:alpha/beta fold hydrolase n=1 Tax=Tenacibaculum sp. MAR_2009_124 TaxID=1250059 RepID=UPI000897FABB|nr:alpha/beta hydrolase [Tenacibaculum sp. MAR_2009_124]SEB51901.1 Pimeloyl-ACP methyl ester carboxylesterase [Tenacibaculum sp. MAR_2009_124]